MSEAIPMALDLVTGRWKSQILHAGVKLGIVDHLENGAQVAAETASSLSLDPANTYRLMRALASIGILEESRGQQFTLTDVGQLFLSSHPNSMRGVCLWEEGQSMYSAWKHLPDVVRDGGEDGFKREFDCAVFDMITSDPEVGTLFNSAMTSYSQRETAQVLTAIDSLDVSPLNHVCDIGGGRGHLLCHFLERHPQIKGTVFELPQTLENPDDLLAGPMNLADRCSYQSGNMFEQAIAADAYFLKHILHDWNDEECVQILKQAHQASGPGARILIAEYIVPGPDAPDFAKLFDIHMMAVLTGKERTEAEYAELLKASGWTHARTWTQPEGSMAVVEGVKAL